jgi:predicted metal-binding membrane protein
VSALETALKRERTIVVAGLVALTLLAWIYILQGAGMGMTALAMTKVALFPHLTPEPMADMALPTISWLTVVAMWWVMMIAMMIPSAAPLILLYGRVMQHAAAQTRTTTHFIPTAFLVTGYLSVWLAFSVAAAALQYALQRAGLISQMMLWSQSALLSAVVLGIAGIYQLSPLKRACLSQCRGPAQFLAQHMRQGKLGALRMGIEHGAWCLGCCWMLMVLLFVGGVMNLIWIALLAVLVLIEKLAPQGVMAGYIAGVVLIAWCVATLMV